MKTTNEIEKALQLKVHDECAAIVDKFINDIEKLSAKYGGSNFYDLKRPPANGYEHKEFMVQGVYGVRTVLQNMLLENHGEAMLKEKSKELIKKLELI